MSTPVQLNLLEDESFHEKFNGKVVNLYSQCNDKYKPEYSSIALAIMSEGFSLKVLAKKLGVARQTISVWRKDHPEFDKAIELGKEASEAFWEEYAYRNKDEKEIRKLLIMNKCDLSENIKTDQTIKADHLDFLLATKEQIKSMESQFKEMDKNE